MRRIVMLVFMSVIVLTGCTQSISKKQDNHEIYACDLDCDDADMSEYTTLQDKDHVFKEITFAFSDELLQEEKFSGIIYYGYPNCPWCNEAVPLMNEIAKKYDQSIFYVNKKSQDSLDHPEEEEQAVALLSKEITLEKDEEGNPHLYVPEVVVIKNGKITSHHMGTVDGHDAHERVMNEEEINQLRVIYETMFVVLKQ